MRREFRMAWYSLYKWFSPWRKTPYSNYVDWYKKYLHRMWFNSLTEEEKKAYLDKQEEDRRKRRMALNQLMMVPTLLSNTGYNNSSLWK